MEEADQRRNRTLSGEPQGAPIWKKKVYAHEQDWNVFYTDVRPPSFAGGRRTHLDMVQADLLHTVKDGPVPKPGAIKSYGKEVSAKATSKTSTTRNS